ncbi:MAG: recombinase [Candidatus Gerdarchaeota archaeon]|nr:MAG: recombinase [Candidatus Gerdarchaeota archaeon]
MEMERLTLKMLQNPQSLIEDFCKDCKLRGMTEESVRRYKSSLKIFTQFLKQKGLNVKDVDVYTLRDFLRYIIFERKNKHKTVENYFSALSTFYDYLAFEGIANTNIALFFRKRYLRRYKNGFDDPERKLLSIEEMSKLVNSIMDPRDKAIAVLLAKTGIRRGELLRLDVEDVNWEEYSITLKPTPKRSNRTVFFDDECAVTLRRWLKVREKLNPPTKALFVSYQSLKRLDRNSLYTAITKYAKRLGYHDPESPRLEDHFSPHCFRHWFTTWLLRNGMPREYVKELRGDKRKEAIDIYHHIDKQELRKAYLACIPKLGI